MCITESHFCAAELKATLKISHTSIQFLEKNMNIFSFFSLPVSFLLTLAPCFVYRECTFFSHIPTVQTLFLKKPCFLMDYSWLTIFWVSGGHQMDSIVCSYVSWSQSYPCHPGCHITEQISLCYTVTHCWLCILNIAVPTACSWRLNSGTLGSLLQPTFTLFGHSRLDWVMYSGSRFPPFSL